MQLHYQGLADGLIIVADSDDSPLHEDGHDASPQEECRLCQIRMRANGVTARLPSAVLRIAVGIAVPAIEAWYLFSSDASLTESTWRMLLGSGPRADVRRNLKKRVYGTEFPSQTGENLKAEQAAKGLLPNLVSFDRHFPGGFGPLAKTLRTWREPAG